MSSPRVPGGPTRSPQAHARLTRVHALASRRWQKFVVFDQVSALASSRLPADALGPLVTQTLLPLLCGAVAGVFATLASQPADVVLTRTNEAGGSLRESVRSVGQQPALVLQGLGPRLLFGVLLTSLQFLFYGRLRSLFGVSKADLTLVWDALAVLRQDVV